MFSQVHRFASLLYQYIFSKLATNRVNKQYRVVFAPRRASFPAFYECFCVLYVRFAIQGWNLISKYVKVGFGVPQGRNTDQ
jgi:hypothetical protein